MRSAPHAPNHRCERFEESRTGLDHIGFMVSGRAEFDAWESRLAELRVEHSPINDQGGYTVLVFRDPDDIQPSSCPSADPSPHRNRKHLAGAGVRGRPGDIVNRHAEVGQLVPRSVRLERSQYDAGSNLCV